jgi:hypothetical protein
MSFTLNTTTGVITQSGTDTDLSGLSAITGVTVYDDDPTRGKVTYDMGDLRLDIDGTLSHDPDRELMIFHHEKSSGSTSVSEPVLTISAGGTYNYGVKTTTSDGKVGYSSGCGLMITGRGYSNWHPSDNAINFGAASANFVCRGGVIECSRGLYFGGNADIEETVFLNASSRFSLEIRVFGNGTISTDRAQNIVLAGGISVMDAYRMTEQKIIFREGAISRVFGSYYEAELFDFDVSKNIFNYDIGNCANNGQSIQDHHIVNSATGSDVRSMWRNTTGNASQMGNTFIHKEVSFNLKDTSGNGIEGVKLYLQDNPSDYAKSISVTTTNGAHTYPTPTLSTAVVSNAGKTISYDYTGAIEYEKTTDANGNISKFRVLTATQFLEYGADDSSATQYFNTFTSGKWTEADGQAPQYSDWDTNRFGDFYKVDRRSNTNSNADDFTFKFGSYGYQLSSTTQALKGLGELEVDWVLFNDDLITQPDKTIVDLYDQIETPEKFYDKAKAYLVDEHAGETSTIVSREGNEINLGSYNLVIDSDASSVFAFDGSTITIKATTFVGNLTTTGVITLADSSVEGTYTDANGTNIILPWSVTNVEATATLQLYNMDKDLEVVNQVVPGTANTKVSDSGTYTTSQIEAGDNIRLRITCQAGVEALLPYEAFAVASSAGVSFRADQKADEVYNANAIDGSAVTTLTADYPNVQIDISDGDGFADSRELYAFAVYQSTTPTGIEQWFDAITAIDLVNYRINTANADIKLQNTGSVPLVITGARIYRDDGTSVLHAEPGDQPMVQDTGELVQYIAPQIDGAMNANAKLDGISNNSKLIPALL